MSRISPYARFSNQVGTPLEETDASFTFAVAQDNRDLFIFKKRNTGTDRTEIHGLTAASNYQEWFLHTGTPLEVSDERYVFLLAPNRDVYVIIRSGTGSGMTELHVLSAETGYQEFSAHVAT